MRIYKIRPPGEGLWLVVKSIDELTPELESASIGDDFEVKVDEMSEEDFKTMREFDGW